MSTSLSRSSMDKRSHFETVALPLMKPVYNYALRLSRNRDEAKDLSQEAFLRAYRTFDNFQTGTNCKAWLFKILYSVFCNRYRKVQREPELVNIDERFDRRLGTKEHDAEAELLRNLSFADASPEIVACLEQLPEGFRAALWLVDVEELSYEEASEVLDCPLGTVRSRLFRARKMLFVSLQDYAKRSGYTRST